MATFDSGATLADRMRSHAAESENLYAQLMRAMADDWERGGPVRQICHGWEDAAAGAVVQLRLLAGVFRIVLTGRAPQLEPFYLCLGGTGQPDRAWPVFREVLAANIDELHKALEIAPQTNEVGRARALLVGIFEAVQRTGLSRIRLLEPGASAGLNLLVDKFRYLTETWSFGPADSALQLRDGFEGGVAPVNFEVVERRGCDLAPVDASSADGQLRLRSFVWPFHVARHDLLVAALRVAAQHPVQVDRGGAGEWLEGQLARPHTPDVLTVVWHSVTQMYWPAAETERVQAAIAAAARQLPIAHIEMEFPMKPDARTAQLTLTLQTPGGAGSDWPGPIVLATVGDHGFPVTLVARP